MLLDRTHQKWAVVSAIIMAVSTVSYLIYAEVSPRGATGGSMMGLIYGVVGTAMMIFAGLLAGKRQVPFWRIGTAQFWLRGHLWLGTLSFPMIMFHAGFGLGGVLEMVLWAFFLIVVLSGFFGLAMQNFLPKLMASSIPRETFAIQVPYIRKRNRVLSDRLVSKYCGRISMNADPLSGQLESIARKAADLRDREAGASKDDKDKIKADRGKWLDWVNDEDRELFRDLARQSKKNNWTRTEEDFTTMVLDTYDVKGIEHKAPAKADKSADSGGDKPEVPVPQIIRLQGAFGSGGQARVDEYLEAVRSGAAPAPTAAAAPAAAPAGAPAADSNGKAEDSGPKIVRVLVDDIGSELQSIRSLLTDKYGFDSALAGKTANYVRPFLVQDPDKEVGSMRDMLIEQYGYDKGAATKAAEQARPFLDELDEETARAIREGKAQKEADEIQALLTEKYGYDRKTASATADQARAFIAGGDVAAAIRNRRADAEVNEIAEMLKSRYGYDDALARRSAEPVRPFVDGSAFAKEEPVATTAKTAALPAAPAASGGSPLDMIRGAGSGGGSPLDMIRGGGTSAPAAPAGGGGELTTVEIIRLQGAPGSGGEERVAQARAERAAGGGPAPAEKAPPPPKKKERPVGPILRTEELGEFYATTVRPYLTSNGREGRLAGETESLRAFSQMRATLPVELHGTLKALENHCEEHRQFAEQERLHRWLHWWLALHIPISIALFVLVGIHIVFALRVVPWTFP